MSPSPINQGTKFLITLFSVFWISFIFIDYLNKHALFTLALSSFHYFDLTLVYLVLGGALVWLAGKSFAPRWFFSGAFAFLLGLVLLFITNQFYYFRVIEAYGLENQVIKAVLVVAFYALFLVFIIAFCFVAGKFLLEKIPLKWKKRDVPIFSILLGISLFMLFLFLFGALKVLNPLVLYGFMAAIFILRYQDALDFLKKIFLSRPETFKKYSWLGFGSLYFLILAISLNLGRIISPMPTGNDAQNYYVNIARLIHDYSGLVEGFQPYNWSLFMASGYVLTGKTEATLTLSFIGGVLALFAFFRLGKALFRMDENYLMLGGLLFYLTPTVFTQSISELKIDLGLLFISLGILLLWTRWLRGLKLSDSLPLQENDWKNSILCAILLGSLLGISLGVKLTSLFLLFALVAGIWHFFFGWKGFLSASLFTLGFVLLIRLDEMIAMRQYHLSVEWVQWSLLALGLAGFTWLLKENTPRFVQVLKISLLIGAFAALFFLPWAGKNLVETGSTSPTLLLRGKKPGAEMNLKILEQRLNNQE
jgi:hypothetical protein